LLIEALYLWAALPETLHIGRQKKSGQEDNNASQDLSIETRRRNLASLETLHFLFLLIFSGCEFTLTFLTFDLLGYSNVQNGKLLAFIGLVSCTLQGGYVRRASKAKGSVYFARTGMQACGLGLCLFGLLPQLHGRLALTSGLLPIYLHVAALCLAYTSASVVTSLTALASLNCDGSMARGEAMGRYRSSGQLGCVSRGLADLY
jgi:hypothetical protein